MQLEDCPHCGVKVRSDRLSKHIERVHTNPPQTKKAQGRLGDEFSGFWIVTADSKLGRLG
jgi:hypothetical protein